MFDNEIAKDYWVVVEVRSGIPVAVQMFSDSESANQYTDSLRQTLNLENDETGIFRVNLSDRIANMAL